MTITEVLEKHQVTTGAACGDGWADILDRLLTDLADLGFKPKYVSQIKEKFGGLRFYYYLEQDQRLRACKNRDRIYARVRQAEQEAYQTCEWCGQPGVLRDSSYWMMTLCDVCEATREVKRGQRTDSTPD